MATKLDSSEFFSFECKLSKTYKMKKTRKFDHIWVVSCDGPSNILVSLSQKQIEKITVTSKWMIDGGAVTRWNKIRRDNRNGHRRGNGNGKLSRWDVGEAI